MDKDIIRSTFWDTVCLITGKLSLAIFSLVAISLTTRILGVEGYGKLALFLAVMQAAFLLGISWTQAAIVRYGIEEYTKTKKINKTVWTRVLFLGPLAFACIVLLYLFRYRIIAYTKISTLNFQLIIAFFIFYSLSSEVQYYLRALNKIKIYGFLQSVEKGIIILGLSFIILKIWPQNVSSVLSVYIFSSALIAVPALILIFAKTMPIQIDKRRFKRMLIVFSLPLLVSTTGVYFFNWIDIIIIKKFMSIQDVGIYSLAYNGMSILQQFSMLTTVITMPLLITFLAKDRIDLIKRYISRIIPQALFLWIVLLSLCIMSARLIIPILGGDHFRQAIIPFSGLLIGLIASGFSSLYTPIIQAYEMMKFATFTAIVMTALKISGDFLLIPKIGISGAVIATSISFFTGAVIRSIVMRKKMGLKADFKILIFSLPAFIVLYCFNIAPSPRNFILGTTAFIASLWLIVIKSNLFSKEDIGILRHINMPVFLKKGIEKFYITMDTLSY